MKANIIELSEIEQYQEFLGNKTLNLKKCLVWGFNVPKFIAIPSFVSKDLFLDAKLKKDILDQIIKILPCDKYAVRSSALIEDSAKQSFAGQFTTKLNLSRDELNIGITEVLKQANEFLHGELEKFSIIIQEYIAPDISGVAFTRNPNGGREMMIEYGFCEGEKIVSGEIKPEKASFYWNQTKFDLPNKLVKNQIIEKFKQLESKTGFPQDIEWCVKNNQFYLLQTRPITTITSQQYRQIIFLEEKLANKQDYFFAKTEISEFAPRPTEFTLSLLKEIYSQNGPISQVYRNHGVNFMETDFLQIIGNELFVDKEKEIKGLLPAYSYLQNKCFIPKLTYYSKTIPTIKNILSLNKIKTGSYEKLFLDLKIRLETQDQEQDFPEALKKILADYELIFEVNLLSGLAIKKLNLLLRKQPVKFPNILAESHLFIDLDKYAITLPQRLIGNSMEISDETDFMFGESQGGQSNGVVLSWWDQMSDFKKKLFEDKLREAIIYNRLRELGRWLIVKNINEIRTLLLNHAKSKGFEDLKNIYFITVEELLNNQINEAFCRERKNNYQSYNQYHLPNTITSLFIDLLTEIQGVSSGIAQGILQDKEYLDTGKKENNQIILYTKILSPDLTKYFDQISGIVSENGGLLSHLAIVAREKNIPVIVGFSMLNNKYKLGDIVEINGSNGKIEIVKKQ